MEYGKGDRIMEYGKGDRIMEYGKTETSTMEWYEYVLGNRYRVQAKWEHIDIVRAKALLANQVGIQRHISYAKANTYVEAMHNGEWIQSLALIHIADTGKLLDGQHRLRAIVDAGKDNIRCLVISGLPESTAAYFDQGRPRSLESVIKGQGIPNSKEMAATVKMMYQLYHNTATPPRNEVGKRIAEDNINLQISVAEAIRMKDAAHMAVPVLAGTHFVLRSHYSKERVDEFFEILTLGGSTRKEHHHPITRLFTTVQDEWEKLQVSSDTRALLGGPKRSGGLPGLNNSIPSMRFTLIAWVYQSFETWIGQGDTLRLRKMCANEEVAKYIDAFTRKLRQCLNIRTSYKDEIENILEEVEDLPYQRLHHQGHRGRFNMVEKQKRGRPTLGITYEEAREAMDRLQNVTHVARELGCSPTLVHKILNFKKEEIG